MTGDEPSVIHLRANRRRPLRSPQERRDTVASFLPALMLVTDWSRLRGRKHGEVLRSAREGGVTMVQMRDRLPVEMPPGLPHALEVEDVPEETLPYVQQIVVTSIDAMLLGAATLGASAAVEAALVFVHSHGQAAAVQTVRAIDGVADGLVGLHIPDRPLAGPSIPPGIRPDRALLGDSIISSRSVHSVDAAVQAARDGADMLVLGTVFPSKSHPGGPTIGVGGVREVCDAVSIPVIGIGGITAQNAGDVIRAGASGVAVIGAIFDAEDPRAAAAELRTIIDAAWAERPHPG